jgi:hypothetical protein
MLALISSSWYALPSFLSFFCRPAFLRTPRCLAHLLHCREIAVASAGFSQSEAFLAENLQRGMAMHKRMMGWERQLIGDGWGLEYIYSRGMRACGGGFGRRV